MVFPPLRVTIARFWRIAAAGHVSAAGRSESVSSSIAIVRRVVVIRAGRHVRSVPVHLAKYWKQGHCTVAESKSAQMVGADLPATGRNPTELGDDLEGDAGVVGAASAGGAEDVALVIDD